MTGQVIEPLFDGGLSRFKGCSSSNETLERGGNVDHLFWQDADSQHRKWGHCVSEVIVQGPEVLLFCFWRQRLCHSRLRWSKKGKIGKYVAVNVPNVYVSLFRIPWICLQTKPASSDNMTTRRSGTWSVTRCTHRFLSFIHNVQPSAKSIQQHRITTFGLLYFVRRGSKSRILLTPTSRSYEDTWIHESPGRWAPILQLSHIFPKRLNLHQHLLLQKFRRRVQESTKVLRELEISLRTNHIG